MNEAQTLIDLIKKKEKLVAMLAPSFPIVYQYPHIITMLRKLGFAYVVEVSAGAQKTNEELLKLLKENPKTKVITSPCPTIVRMIKKTMPQYAKYLTNSVDSPMIATAKIVKKAYPNHQPVFIGPCVMKKMEAKEDYPHLNILVLTYLELSEVFTYFDIQKPEKSNDKFDISAIGLTRLYPIDGGLSHSSGLTHQLPKEAIKVVSGVQNNLSALEEFEKNPKINLLDILNCLGGCIGGPGIKSNLTLEERRKKVIEYTQSLT